MEMSAAATDMTSPPHIPVLLDPLLRAVAPVSGRWLDGTFGAGGYTRGLLEAGAEEVIAIDRDPLAFDLAADWAGDYGEKIQMHSGVFSEMDTVATDLDGVVLDLGVSSMQLDQAERGFSFMTDSGCMIGNCSPIRINASPVSTLPLMTSRIDGETLLGSRGQMILIS